jgi:hypothetical protein
MGGGACATHEKLVQNLIGEPERNWSFGKILLRWVFKQIGCEDLDWIQLGQVRDQWRALVNTSGSLRVR